MAAGINVESIDTTFNASIELPSGMKFKDANPTVQLLGANGKFEITNSSLNGNKVDVPLSLRILITLDLTNELKSAVSAVDDNLKVVVKGAQFTSAATADTNYTVIGKVSGSSKQRLPIQ